MKSLLKLLFAIASSHVLKDRQQVLLNRMEARHQLEQVLGKAGD